MDTQPDPDTQIGRKEIDHHVEWRRYYRLPGHKYELRTCYFLCQELCPSINPLWPTWRTNIPFLQTNFHKRRSEALIGTIMPEQSETCLLVHRWGQELPRYTGWCACTCRSVVYPCENLTIHSTIGMTSWDTILEANDKYTNLTVKLTITLSEDLCFLRDDLCWRLLLQRGQIRTQLGLAGRSTHIIMSLQELQSMLFHLYFF